MLELISRMGRFGISVLLATHLLDDVQQVCDHVVMLDAGRLVVDGATASLLEGTGRLTLDVGTEHGPLVAALAKRRLRASEVHGLLEVELRGEDDLDLVRDLIADLGLPLHRMTTGISSLDEVFVDRATSAAREREART
jgi:ABC-2 type transport system ATP-binding protein